MAEITDSLDRLLIGVDNLSAVADAVSQQISAAVGGFGDTFETVGENLTNQLDHLAKVTEAVGANITSLISAIGRKLGINEPELNSVAEEPALRGLPEFTPTASPQGQQAGPKGFDWKGMLDGVAKQFGTLAATAAQLGSHLGGLTGPFSIAGGALKGLGEMVSGTLGPVFGAAGAAVQAATQGFERIVGVMAQLAEVGPVGH